MDKMIYCVAARLKSQTASMLNKFFPIPVFHGELSASTCKVSNTHTHTHIYTHTNTHTHTLYTHIPFPFQVGCCFFLPSGRLQLVRPFSEKSLGQREGMKVRENCSKKENWCVALCVCVCAFACVSVCVCVLLT